MTGCCLVRLAASKYRDGREMNRSIGETKAGCSLPMHNPVIIRQYPLWLLDYVIANIRKWLQGIK